MNDNCQLVYNMVKGKVSHKFCTSSIILYGGGPVICTSGFLHKGCFEGHKMPSTP